MKHDYRPRWTDPRVKARTEAVLEWCSDNLHHDWEKPVSAQLLDKVFGPIGNRLGDYLRANLLVRSSMYKPGVSYYKYSLVKGGLEKIAAAASTNYYFVNTSSITNRLDRLKAKFQSELDSLEFEYSTKSNRYWHPIQMVPRAYKNQFWAGKLPYSYDIETCAATLFKQTATKAGLPDIINAHLQNYLDFKTEFRQHVADLAGVDVLVAKKLINGMFNGARLARNSRCSIYKILLDYHSPGEASRRMTALQSDPDLKLLRLSIRYGWKKIGQVLHTEVKTAKQKSVLYYVLERKVLDAMKTELTRQGLKFFTEHDGFRCNAELDLVAMTKAVKRDTGFNIRLKLDM